MNKIDDLHMLIQQTAPDVIFITETWLSNSHDNCILALHNFTVFRKDRNHGNDAHGGVLLAIKTTLNPVLVAVETNIEVLFADIKLNYLKIRLCVNYRPPSTCVNDSIAIFDLIRRYADISDRVCLVGDFNLPSINWNNCTSHDYTSNYFLSFVDQLNFHQMVDEPTRNTSILDLVLCSDADCVADLKVHETFSHSDHCYITFNLQFIKNIEPDIEYFNYKEADWDLMRGHLALISWEGIFVECENDVEVVYEKFKNTLENLVSLCVPKRVVCRNNRNSPWFNDNLKRMTRKKQRKWNRYKRSRSERLLREYRAYCKSVHDAANLARVSYERNKFFNKSNKPKEFFNYIDKRTKTNCGIPSLKSGPVELVDNIDKAEAFNRHYGEVFTQDDGIQPYFPPKMPPNTFSSFEISDQSIIKAVRKLNGSGAPGIDNVHPAVIKNVFPYLVKPLKFIFKLSLSSGKLPDIWKQGIICPIYKSNGMPQECGSYRPICLTSVVCKMMEYIVHDRLTLYLLSNGLISKDQHGFLAKRSTTTNLLECLNCWTKTIDQKKSCDVIYIDMAKAFDTVSNRKLFHKLSLMRIGSMMISLMEDFLMRKSSMCRCWKRCLCFRAPSFCPTFFRPKFFVQSISSNAIRFG